jgi:type II secretory pathway component PulF
MKTINLKKIFIISAVTFAFIIILYSIVLIYSFAIFPNIKVIFSDLGAKPPVFSRFIFDLSSIIKNPISIVLSMIIILGISVLNGYLLRNRKMSFILTLLVVLFFITTILLTFLSALSIYLPLDSLSNFV